MYRYQINSIRQVMLSIICISVAIQSLPDYVTNLSNQLYTVENLYITSNNFFRGLNIVLEKPVKILNTGVDVINRVLMVGDGRRLTIYGQYGTEGMFGAFKTNGGWRLCQERWRFKKYIYSIIRKW